MENQKKKSILEQGINWIGACVPTRNELKTQQMKIFFKILLLILCILIAGFVVMVIISIYVLGFLLRFFWNNIIIWCCY